MCVCKYICLYICIFVCIRVYVYIAKVCLKSNGTGITNNLFEFQITNFMVFPLKSSLSSLINFPILLCHVSIHCWKNSSGMLFSSVIMNLFMAFMPSKQVFLNLRNKKSHVTKSDK